MKIRIPREDILKPLQRVIGAVERRQTLPVLANVLITAQGDTVTLTATDLELELQAATQAEIEAEGEVTIPARKLLDICRTLPEGVAITLETQESKAVVRAARSRFSLATLPPAEFPSLDEIQAGVSFDVGAAALRRVLERTAFSMAQQDVRYYLNGLLVEIQGGQLRAVATDGHRLAIAELDGSVQIDGEMQLIVPRKGVQEMLRLLADDDGDITVRLSDNHVQMHLAGLRFTSKLIDGPFPEYQRVLPQGGDKIMKADRETLRLALQRASILSNEKYKGIRLVLESEELKIQTHNPDQEEAEEELAVDYQGDALEIGFNVMYLLEILGVIDAEQAQFTFKDSNSSCLVEDPADEHSRFVVMPMRL